MSSPLIKTYRAPAASNYFDKIGYIVLKSTTDEVVLAADGTVLPLGIITDAANEAGGIVSVCVDGECYARFGAAVTVGTHHALMADADGECIAGTAGNFCVGRALASVTAADNDLLPILVAPFELET